MGVAEQWGPQDQPGQIPNKQKYDQDYNKLSSIK